MVLNVTLLDHQENFVKFLRADHVTINETCEDNKIKRIKFNYAMQDLHDAKNLFKIGYKLWISGDNNLTDCLYVINTSVERDYFKENQVTFEAEEVLVELNYAPLFNQVDLIEENGFTITTINDEENVTVDYAALDFWFGEYFNIGIVQKCLSAYVSRITPTGTMTKMELLRFIEEETSNIFVTRYEKDTVTNVIHRYLDFLNPSKNNKDWELNIKHKFIEAMASSNISLYDEDGDLIDEGEIIVEPEGQSLPGPEDLDVASCYFKLLDENGETLFERSASSLGLSKNLSEIRIKMVYSNKKISISINEITYAVDRWIDGQNAEGSKTETEIRSTNIGQYNLVNKSVFIIYDKNKTWYHRVINPQTGNVHDEVLDLGYNVENIDYEIDESDTFTAISPVLGSSNSANSYTKSQLDTVILQWMSLEIKKGDVIPMIVQKVTTEDKPTDDYMSGSIISSKYYSRPVAPNDADGKYEYFKASSYWKAPFNKVAGEMYVTDESLTDIEYNQIFAKPDTIDERPNDSFKIGTVSTSDEDPYAIYNDVAMKLKDKSSPEVTIEVDVANLINHNYNDYSLHDIVYIKVPGFEKLITAEVVKTEKTAHDINKNKIKLSNYSINAKVSSEDTYITGSNVSYTYPETSQLDVTLKDSDDNTLSGKLLTFSVYAGSSFSTSYTRITKDNGGATLPLRLNPGNYKITVAYAGETEYAASEQSFEVNVGGTIEEKTESTTTTSTEKTYYSNYGVSPDGKSIMAIGRPSSAAENKYGYTFYKSTFVRKCPHCGSTDLVWGIFWAGNETSNWGRFPGNGQTEGGSAEGHIFCKKCDADYGCILGSEHVSRGRTLQRISGPTKVSKQEAYTLKAGQMVYEEKTTTVETEANTNSNRAGPIANISEKVKTKALSIAGASTGLEAAKKIAQWCGTNIKYANYNNFQRSPDSVLNMSSGNCCDQTRLMLQMMDAAGVTAEFQLIYVHVVSGGRGHVFAKVNGTYVDPCKASPWGNYVTGYGVPGSAPNSVYPKLPF